MLELKNISKKYGKVTALKSVSITLGSGIYALLGPNGSGKSTMMNIIAGILPPTDGEILYNAQGIQSLGTAYREKIGYMPQYPGMYPSFTARDFLLYMSELKGLPRGSEGEVSFEWLHTSPHPGDVVIRTDGKTVEEITNEMRRTIDGFV